MKKKKTIFAPLFAPLIAAVLVCAACQMEPSGNVRYRSAEFAHPGVLHTQDEFAALGKLIEKWDGGSIPQAPNQPEPARPNINIYDNQEELPFARSVEYRDGKRANRKVYAEHRAYKSWQWLKADSLSQSSYGMGGPFEYVGRDGTYSGTKGSVEKDFAAAYQNALMWILTGDRAHAAKSFEILDAYGNKLKGILGGDYRLMAGLQGMTLAAGLELLRYAKDINGNDSGFIPEQFAAIDNMLRTVWIPALERFYAYPAHTEGNVGLCVTGAYMGLSIYLNDRAMYQKALHQYLEGADDGSLRYYLDPISGQTLESDRDQPHAMLGFMLTGYIAETAWKQGDDVYSAYDNVLFKATEFITRYNSGDNNIVYGYPIKFASDNPQYWFNPEGVDVASLYPGNPYVGNPEKGFWGSHSHGLSTSGRGDNRPTWEFIYNHYANRKGMYMPWTESYLYLDGETAHSTDKIPLAGSFLYSGVEVARILGLYDARYPYQ
jgi:hypothetical protein